MNDTKELLYEQRKKEFMALKCRIQKELIYQKSREVWAIEHDLYNHLRSELVISFAWSVLIIFFIGVGLGATSFFSIQNNNFTCFIGPLSGLIFGTCSFIVGMLNAYKARKKHYEAVEEILNLLIEESVRV